MSLNDAIDAIVAEAISTIEDKLQEHAWDINLVEDMDSDEGYPDELYEMPVGYVWTERFGVTNVYPIKIYNVHLDDGDIYVRGIDLEDGEEYELAITDLNAEVIAMIADMI